MIGKIFDRMESVRPAATKTELLLIDKLKNFDKNDLIYLSITELADMLDVAEATILRFCRKLGLAGFQDFKLTLSQDIATEQSAVVTKPLAVAESMNEAVMQTEKEIKYESILDVARNIMAAKKICAFGMGNSSVAPLALKNRLLKTGIIIENTCDTHSQALTVANLNKDDLLILFSVSGSTLDLIKLADIAKKSGTPLIIVTNYSKSPLAKKGDIILQTSKKEAAYEGGSLASVVSQLYMVDIICVAVFELLGQDAMNKSVKASSAVTDKSV